MLILVRRSRTSGKSCRKRANAKTQNANFSPRKPEGVDRFSFLRRDFLVVKNLLSGAKLNKVETPEFAASSSSSSSATRFLAAAAGRDEKIPTREKRNRGNKLFKSVTYRCTCRRCNWLC